MNSVGPTKELLQQFDQMIRQGQGALVFNECAKISAKDIPRPLLSEFGDLAQRIGRPLLSLKWLGPVIHPEKPVHPPASIDEQRVYTQALVRIGSFREAKMLLSHLFQNQSDKKEPYLYFVQASFYINQWDYKKEIPFLRQHIRSSSQRDYRVLVSRINLIAALVATEHLKRAGSEADRLESWLIRNNSSGQVNLLLGNLYEIRTQLEMLNGEYDRAEALIRKSEGLLKKADDQSMNYVKKWKTLLRIKRLSSEELAEPFFQGQIRDVQTECRRSKDWETLRDLDFQLALAQRDENRFLRVYWGSKSKAYRRRIRNIFRRAMGKAAIPHHYQWAFEGVEDGPHPIEIDLIEQAPTVGIKKLMVALTRDLYRPLQIGEVFDLVFPGEYFNPQSSPARLFRLMSRARQWWNKERWPLEIQSERGGFKLHATSPLCLKLTRSLKVSGTGRWQKNREWLKTQSVVTAESYRHHGQVSLRTARAHLKRFEKEGLLQALSFRRKKTYRVKAASD